MKYVQEMLGLREAENGTQIEELLQARASGHQRTWQDVEQRIQVLEDGRCPAKEVKHWRFVGEKRRITGKEYRRLSNEFETEDDDIHETDLAALLGNSGEDTEADDALAEALQLDAVAMVAWQRFNGKGKGKSKCKGKIKGKGNRGTQETSCRAEEPYQLPSVRCAWTLGRRRHLSQECQERGYVAITRTRISDYRRRDIRFRPHLDR